MKVVYGADKDGVIESDLKQIYAPTEQHFLYYSEEGRNIKDLQGAITDNNCKYFWHCNHSDPYVGTKDYHITWPEFDMLLSIQPLVQQRQSPTHLYFSQQKSLGYHRDLLMNLLYRQRLLSKGLVSYAEDSGPDEDHLTIKYIKDSQKFKFNKSWHNNIHKWFPSDRHDNSLIWNIEDNPPPPISTWYKSCFNIITESYYDIEAKDTSLLTEKTYSCLLHAQPFIIVGCQNIHKKIEDEGYKLYTDVFDYSFDKLPTIEARTEAIVKQIKNLKINMFKSTIETAKYNQTIFLDKVKRLQLPSILTSEDYVFYPEAQRHKEKILKIKKYADNM
jgi:hypothetical protein